MNESDANETPVDAAAQAETDADLKAAEQELKRARQRLRKAKQSVREARQKARQEGAAGSRDSSLGDLLERTLSLVKKHPGIGLAAAAAAGFVLGRIFRRW